MKAQVIKVRKLLCPGSTLWKLEDFSVSQILREIKVGESRVSKTSVLTHLRREALNFDYLRIFAHFVC